VGFFRNAVALALVAAVLTGLCPACVAPAAEPPPGHECCPVQPAQDDDCPRLPRPSESAGERLDALPVTFEPVGIAPWLDVPMAEAPAMRPPTNTAGPPGPLPLRI
jgi:hypothetical protein